MRKMPLWLVAAAIGAFIVYRHAHASAAGSATGAGGNVTVADSNGVTYSLQTDPALDAATLSQIKAFFATAGQTDATATALVQSLIAKSLTTTAQGVQNVYGQMQANNSLKAQMMGTGQ